MRKKLLCLCTAVLLDLCFLGIMCRLAVGMQWEDLAEVEQADQTVSSPECFSGGELALTFDDGPHRVYTKKLLDGLRERGVKASFFLVGENIPGNEELVRQMAKDGHLIVGFTAWHMWIWRASRLKRAWRSFGRRPIGSRRSRENVRNTYVRRMVHGVRSFRRECR